MEMFTKPKFNKRGKIDLDESLLDIPPYLR